MPIALALFARLAPPQINSTVIGIYYLSLFTGNSIVGWVGGWFEDMKTTDFWLMHVGFAATAGLVFVIYKVVLSRVLFASERESEPVVVYSAA